MVSDGVADVSIWCPSDGPCVVLAVSVAILCVGGWSKVEGHLHGHTVVLLVLVQLPPNDQTLSCSFCRIERDNRH